LPLIPKDKIILETDSPYLTPHPHRGTTNEPKYTILVAQKVAKLLDLSFEEVQKLTTSNAKRLFGGLGGA
jgi:TatD DNase family protein